MIKKDTKDERSIIKSKKWAIPKIHKLNIKSHTKGGKHSDYEHGNHHHPDNPPS